VRNLRRNIATFCALDAYSEAFKRGVLVDHLEAFWPPR
jgi:hypothetical protein